MLDFSHIPSNTDYIQRFEANSISAGAGWHTWVKPRGAKFVQFTVIAGGGGGASGVLGSNSAAAGGGGGGSSAHYKGFFSTDLIPDILYISVGFGGAGGAAVPIINGSGLIGIAGVASYISIAPNLTTTTQYLCTVNGGGVGVAPVGATAGATGGGGAVTSISNMPLSTLGIQTGATGGGATNATMAGQIGAAGGAAVGGLSLLLPGSGIVLGGGSGGGGLGLSSTVGAIGGFLNVSSLIFPIVLGGVAGGTTTANGGDGTNGFQPIQGLFYYMGGAGGASGGGAGGNGGRGGNGAYGCGGGGGGAALTGFTSGAGGNGGNGLVIASCW